MKPNRSKVNPVPARSTITPFPVEVVELAGRRKWPDDSATVALVPFGEWQEVTLEATVSQSDLGDLFGKRLTPRRGKSRMTDRFRPLPFESDMPDPTDPGPGTRTPPDVPAEWSQLLGAEHDGYLTCNGQSWRATRFVGKGTFGRVFEVHLADDLAVVAAVKFPREINPGSRSLVRFDREWKLMKEHAFRCLPDFLGHGTTELREPGSRGESVPFFLMKLMVGQTLKQCIEDRIGTPGVPESIAFGIGLTAAVRELHEKGILHRDLSESNIWILPDGSVRLLDIGCASDPGGPANFTMPQERLGTPQIVDPRLWRGVPADAGSDLYAIGCNLVRFVTNNYPFPQGTQEVEPGTVPAIPGCDGGDIGREPLCRLIRELFAPAGGRPAGSGGPTMEIERRLAELAATYSVVLLDPKGHPITPLIADATRIENVKSGIWMVFPKRDRTAPPTDRELIVGATAVYKIGHLSRHALRDLAQELKRWAEKQLPQHHGTASEQNTTNALPALQSLMTRFEARTDLLRICYEPFPELLGLMDGIRSNLESDLENLTKYLTDPQTPRAGDSLENRKRSAKTLVQRTLRNVVKDMVQLRRLLNSWAAALRASTARP